jgi:predicted ATP-dependent protease
VDDEGIIAGLTPLDVEALSPSVDLTRLVALEAMPPAGPSGCLGQERAVRALELGAAMRSPGFNVFVLGPEGSGRHSLVRLVGERAAKSAEASDDWVYVHNFETEWKPTARRLPAGEAQPLREAVAAAIDSLRSAIPALFESDDYRERRRQIDAAYEEQDNAAFEVIRERARSEGVGIMRTPMGFALAPLRNGEAVRPDAFEQLPAPERERYQERIAALQEELAELLRQAPDREQKRRKEIRALNAEDATIVIDRAVADPHARFGHLTAVAAQLEAVRGDLIDRVELFVVDPRKKDESPFPEVSVPIAEDRRFRRYLVNVVVTNRKDAGAPLVYEDHPTLARLVGRVEHVSRMGALETDFTMIRPGALHRANGGYLVLDAHRVLREPWSWEALKRALRSGSIAITSAAQELSLISTVTLEPEPIPLDVRVVLVGERILYYLLVALDPEFDKLFKLQADFEDALPRDDVSLCDYACLIRSAAERNGTRPLEPAAVAAVIGEAARIASDARKLSLRFGPIVDLIREADHWAGIAGRKEISAEEVRRAVEERTFRADRLGSAGMSRSSAAR